MDDQQKPIKGQIVFDQHDANPNQPGPQQSAASAPSGKPLDELVKPLQEQLIFDQQSMFNKQPVFQVTGQGVDESSTADSASSLIGEPALTLNRPRRHWSTLAKCLGASVLAIVGIESAMFFTTLWAEQPMIAALYSTAAALAVGLAGKAGLSEYRYLQRLKQQHRWQQDCERLSHSEQIGAAKRLCGKISQSLPADAAIEQRISAWQGALKDTDTDKDILTLYNQMVLEQIDNQAMKVISRFSSETALMVAISPLALVDMAVVLWRSTKMIEQVCFLYGVKLGYWSRIRLIRTVLTNVVYAGTSELIADVGSAAFSLELAGKMSTRAAQGLGAGLLTGRLGLKVMQLCRPMAALPNKQKRLADLSGHILQRIKQAIGGA